VRRRFVKPVVASVAAGLATTTTIIEFAGDPAGDRTGQDALSPATPSWTARR
jgi:hypothetical protein